MKQYRASGCPRGCVRALLLCAGCAADQPVSDAGGTNIDALPIWRIIEDLRIGSVDDPDYGFSSIGGVDVDAEGAVYVLESDDKEIRVYSPDGRLMRKLGRRGDGPGEFSSNIMNFMSFGVGGDTVWAYEWSSRRLTLFDRAGNLLSATRIQEVIVGVEITGLPVRVGPAWRTADGLFIAEPNPANLLVLFDVHGDSVRLPHLRFDGKGLLIDTVGSFTAPVNRRDPHIIQVGQSSYVVPEPPYTDPLLLTLWDGRVYVDRPASPDASKAVFTVTRVTFDGDTLFATSFSYTPVRYPDTVLDSIARRAARGTGQIGVYMADGSRKTIERSSADSAAARAAIRRSLSFPAFQAPIQGYQTAADGSLWLRRENTGGATDRWLVLDADGEGVAHVLVPRGDSWIAWTSLRTLWMVEYDALDIPWLVRYRITVNAGERPDVAMREQLGGSRAGRDDR